MRLASFGTVHWRETLQSWRVLNDPDCAPIRLPGFVCVGGMIQMPNALTPEELSDRFAVFRLSEYAESFAELVGETIREAIAVEPIPQPFGGRRWYFRCPRCGRRCASLYVLTTSFGSDAATVAASHTTYNGSIMYPGASGRSAGWCAG